MTKRKNSALQHGGTPREAILKLIEKALVAGADGVRDAETFLTAYVTASNVTEGAVSALDFSVKFEMAPSVARKARKKRAEAWQAKFRMEAVGKWSGQSEASHWLVKTMAAELLAQWKQDTGDYPCKQSTAERFLSPIHAEIRRSRKR